MTLIYNHNLSVLTLLISLLPLVHQIQIQSYHDTWWGIDSSDPPYLSCNKKYRTSDLVDSPLTFTVSRVGPAAVRLITSNGQYVAALENGRIGTTEWIPSPRTVFVVQQVRRTDCCTQNLNRNRVISNGTQ